jgi:hypothetical protein
MRRQGGFSSELTLRLDQPRDSRAPSCPLSRKANDTPGERADPI